MLNYPCMTETNKEYIIKLKEQIPVCPILGVNIAAIDMEWLLKFTHEHIKELDGEYICVSNVHTTVTAYNDESYRSVQNNALLAIPDGGPLSTLGRKRGFEHMSRVTGPSYLEEILKVSKQYGYKHYFYGSSKEVTDVMIKNINDRYPGIDIAGVFNPPYRPLSREEDEEVIKKIREADPDFIWVGLGAPKQEIWMADHKGKLPGVMVGVGAAFDYLAGNIKRAPLWMQKANLEWLYRLYQDPKRLFKRYVVTNSSFIWNAVIKGK